MHCTHTHPRRNQMYIINTYESKRRAHVIMRTHENIPFKDIILWTVVDKIIHIQSHSVGYVYNIIINYPKFVSHLPKVCSIFRLQGRQTNPSSFDKYSWQEPTCSVDFIAYLSFIYTLVYLFSRQTFSPTRRDAKRAPSRAMLGAAWS